MESKEIEALRQTAREYVGYAGDNLSYAIMVLQVVEEELRQQGRAE